MLGKYNYKEGGLLVNLIKRRIDKTPNFALLLGAGASVSSGVKPSNEMINEWRQQLFKESKFKKRFEEWLSEQNWYNDDEEYSILFERIYDQPAQRRNYIEECIKNAGPSWGYIYLSSIISQGFFNVVFTPNFDDLLNEACFSYANCRPIVCAHDSAVSTIRVTSTRPKIIKLHGDFLYDNIKNTVRETEDLEKNMRDKFEQFAKEYGLVVIGYRGNDRSIMDVLDSLLRKEGCFPHGIYWCMKKGSKPCRKLDRLLSRERVFIVEIDGFDEFMADLHEGLDLTLPDAVKNPYRATTERLNRSILPAQQTNHEVIRKDVAELQAQIKQYESFVNTGVSPRDAPVPYEFLAENEYKAGRLKNAIEYFMKAVIQRPNAKVLSRLTDCYRFAGQNEKALETAENLKVYSRYLGFRNAGYVNLESLELSLQNLDEAIKYAEDDWDKSIALNGKSNTALVHNKNQEALAFAEEALKFWSDNSTAIVNKCTALKRLGKGGEAKEILEKTLPNVHNEYLLACFHSALGSKEAMLEHLEKALQTDRISTIYDFKKDPDFIDWQNDPDVKHLLDKYPQT